MPAMMLEPTHSHRHTKIVCSMAHGTCFAVDISMVLLLGALCQCRGKFDVATCSEFRAIGGCAPGIYRRQFITESHRIISVPNREPISFLKFFNNIFFFFSHSFGAHSFFHLILFNFSFFSFPFTLCVDARVSWNLLPKTLCYALPLRSRRLTN